MLIANTIACTNDTAYGLPSSRSRVRGFSFSSMTSSKTEVISAKSKTASIMMSSFGLRRTLFGVRHALFCARVHGVHEFFERLRHLFGEPLFLVACPVEGRVVHREEQYSRPPVKHDEDAGCSGGGHDDLGNETNPFSENNVVHGITSSGRVLPHTRIKKETPAPAERRCCCL